MGFTGGSLDLIALQTEFASRNLTPSRVDALLRVADGSSGVLASSNGTYSHAVGTSEADALEFLLLKLTKQITFDMNALLQSTTVRVYEKVGGATYRKTLENVYPTDFPNLKAVELIIAGKNRDVKITFQSAVAEAGIIAVPYTEKTWVT